MRMNDFLHALQAELNAAEPNFGDDANTVLGLLYQAMNGKPLREKDEIIDTVCRLCSLHQQTGFTDGIKLGIRLVQEITSS